MPVLAGQAELHCCSRCLRYVGPAVHSVRLSGLMEVLPHPNFAQNHFVYLTYTKDVGPNMVATTLARGRLEGHGLVEVKDILVCDSWAGDGGSGSRLAWGKDGMLYMTTGASNGMAAQEGTSLRGKILRLRDDGSPAPGNPFTGKAGYKAEIYSMGHRNSLGLAFNPVTGDLWNNENGPYGGDEINIIKPGANYGWPLVSFGRDYSGPQIVSFKEGMVGPIVFWAPSIAPSGMAFYTGDRFPVVEDQLGLVEPVHRLGEGIVVGVALRSDRGHDSFGGQALRVANGQILHAAVRVMHQLGQVLPGPDGLLQRVEGQIGPQRGGHTPADDHPAEHVDDEGHVAEALPGGDVGVGVGPGRPARLSSSGFPRPALRTGRAASTASGSPRVHAAGACGPVVSLIQGVGILVPR